MLKLTRVVQLCLVVVLLQMPSLSMAQVLRDGAWGFAFTAPTGWTLLDQNAEGALFVSADQSSYLVIEPHELTGRDALARAARRGYQNTGVVLTAASDPTPYGDGVAVEMQGSVQGQEACAHAIGLLSPHGGGAIVLIAVGQAQWTADAARVAETVAASFEFFASAAAPAVIDLDWTTRLAGHCVAYMRSSGSTGNAVGGFATGSFTSDSAKLYLYPDGSFQSGANHSASFDAGVGFGNVASSGAQAGQWTVVSQSGRDVLQLRNSDGSTGAYELTTNEQGHTFLDGDRWFVVSYQECTDL